MGNNDLPEIVVKIIMIVIIKRSIRSRCAIVTSSTEGRRQLGLDIEAVTEATSFLSRMTSCAPCTTTTTATTGLPW